MTRTEPLLIPEHLRRLAGFASANVLLAFDYDGTLAPLADRPEDAHMRATTRQLLESVARAYPTVVISGRALADVTAMLDRVPLWYVYGNHGLEPPGPGATSSTDAHEWARRLAPRLSPDLGIRVEDKGHTLTLHYRGVRDRARAVTAIEEALQALPEVSILQGNEAINVLPRGGNKGVALSQAMKTFACHQAIYVGDEDTDEAAFYAGGELTLAIRIEPSEQSHARYHLGSQQDIDRLLRALIDVRVQR